MDRTLDSRRLKLLTVTDEYTHLGLAIEVARSMTSEDVKQVLELLFAIHGRPDYLRSDNGPEFIAKELQDWLKISM
jgi:transposase InsO family protein